MDYWFSGNLRKYRKERGFTQERLAKSIGVAHNTISDWENSTRYPSIDKVYDIARVLNVGLNELLDCPESLV